MSRVLLVGQGPLPERSGSPATAHGLRTFQFAEACARSGHAVDLFVLRRPERGASSPVSFGGRTRAFDSEESLRAGLEVESFGAIAAIGATSYGSYLLATSAVALPAWLDLNGDPIAEAQSQARAASDERPLHDGWWLLTTIARRGDRFSTVSSRQRLALLGQLGVLGRLNRSTAEEELVAVVPESVAATDGERPRSDARTVLFSGGFASWVDGGTLASALASILESMPGLRFVATGGQVAGLDPAPWRRFVSAIERLGSDRARIEGWVDAGTLESFERDALCGVVPELPSIERELGGQNRGLRWMSRGVPVVTTGLSEIGAELGRLGLVRTYRPLDPASLARSVLELASDGSLRESIARRALDWVRENRDVEVTTAPLLDWLRDPRPAGDRIDGTAERSARRLPEMLRDQLHLESERSRRGSGDDGSR